MLESLSALLKKNPSIKAFLLLFPFIVVVVVFLVFPIFAILEKSVHPLGPEFTISSGYSWENYKRVFDSQYMPIFLRSLSYAGITTILCFLMGYPLAYFIAMYGGKRKNLYILLIMLPFWTSYLIRTFAWMTILRSEGLLNSLLKSLGIINESIQFLNTPFAVILGLTYGFLPFMTLPLYVALEKIDYSLVEASLDLGASPATAFFKVVFPLSLPGVIAGSLLTFIPCVGDFVAADVLGGPETTMIGNIIQQQFLESFNWPFGSALSFILMVIMLGFIFSYVRAVGTDNV